MCLRRLHVFCAVVWRGMVGRGCREAFVWICRRKNQPPSFRAAASRPVTDGHESSRLAQSGIIENPVVIFAWTRQNQRKPLHHVLRTAGRGGAFEGGALRGGGGGAGPMERGQNAEVRGQEKPNSQQPFNAKGARAQKVRKRGRGAKRSLKHTGARPVDGAGRGGRKTPRGRDGFPCNLKPERTARGAYCRARGCWSCWRR